MRVKARGSASLLSLRPPGCPCRRRGSVRFPAPEAHPPPLGPPGVVQGASGTSFPSGTRGHGGGPPRPQGAPPPAPQRQPDLPPAAAAHDPGRSAAGQRERAAGGGPRQHGAEPAHRQASCTARSPSPRPCPDSCNPTLPTSCPEGLRQRQAELGKPRRSCYTLPGYDFAYGLYLHGDDGGVPEAIGHWHSMKPKPPSPREMPRDYKTMNRGALKAGYVTACEFNLYRQLKDIRCNEDDESRFKRAPPKVPPDMTYGMLARPSTPFFDLLQHRYKEVWMEQQRAIVVAQQVEKKKLQKRKVYETRTSLLRKQPPPVKLDSLWHMPHFQKVGPHLSTFPDRDAHKKAFSVYHSEIPVRCGPLAQGIYTAA